MQASQKNRAEQRAKIYHASFLTSAPSVNETPVDAMAEIAFLGRSNVGKSSLLNSLTHRKQLAKSSSTPGKTQLINLFNISIKRDETQLHGRFVDLPGFGYAKVSKKIKHQWQRNLTEFIENRANIVLFIHLIDARHPSLEIDENVRKYLQEIKKPNQKIVELFTKVDKLNQKEMRKLEREHEGALMVSNSKNRGLDRVRELIFNSLGGGLV